MGSGMSVRLWVLEILEGFLEEGMPRLRHEGPSGSKPGTGRGMG